MIGERNICENQCNFTKIEKTLCGTVRVYKYLSAFRRSNKHRAAGSIIVRKAERSKIIKYPLQLARSALFQSRANTNSQVCLNRPPMNNATTTSRRSIAKGERDRVPGGDYVGSKEGSRNVITVIVGSFLT